MPKSSAVVEALQITEEKLRIVEAALIGKQPATIAREVGKSRQHVLDVLDEALADVSFILLERVERLHMINLLRMERLIEAAMPYAIGAVPLPDGNGNYPPDREWNKAAAGLIKLEMDWEDRLYERRAKRPEDNPDRIAQTIMAHDDMYSLAQVNMEADWLDQFADMDAQDLLPTDIPDEEVQQLVPSRDLERLEKKVNKLLAARGDEEGEENDDLL
ncbi:hypothetical protein Rctr85_021 [Virus Rctr85]|nr:hypothetical protein Rctr85_021 [Virus Rctr85]